jgi:branched-chain amino acid transport system ATP-binding protein
MFQRFPQLAARRHVRAGVLSGGEQQLLTLCRALMGGPGMVMVDEPTEGLAPAVVLQIRDLLLELQQCSISILLVEQKLAMALDISQRVYVMGHGRMVFEGTPEELKVNALVRKEWLEV